MNWQFTDLRKTITLILNALSSQSTSPKNTAIAAINLCLMSTWGMIKTMIGWKMMISKSVFFFIARNFFSMSFTLTKQHEYLDISIDDKNLNKKWQSEWRWCCAYSLNVLFLLCLLVIKQHQIPIKDCWFWLLSCDYQST